MDLPIIDIAPFDDDPVRRSAIARTVDEACAEIGFLVVTGHGIGEAVFADAFAAARRYFVRPDDRKAQDRPASPDLFRGYEAMGTRYRAAGPAGARVADYKEAYMISRPSFDRPGFAAPPPPGLGRMYAPNIWPAEPSEFRPVFTRFYEAVDDLARRMNRIFAAALDLPEDYFADKFDNHASTCTWVHYPAQQVAPEPGQMRIPAHTDSTSLTIVVQDDSPHGLEIRTRDGRWQAVRSPPGSVVVNLGDLMAQWTNDRWVSTLHRVDNPPPEIARTTPRYSLCFFQKPNVDVEIRCLPSCVTPDRPAKYPPVQAGDYIRAKMLGTRPPPPQDMTR
jgi:isopenicillin N synthase-like dioxygenase